MKIPTLCSQHFVDGCTRPARARGLCGRHIQRFYKHGDPNITLHNRSHDGSCAVIGCEMPYMRRGLCRVHADRRDAHGSPTLADELIAEQHGLCAVCRKLPRGRGHEGRLHLDHDHETGFVRGMLCGPCNKALGLFHDDPALLRAAASYLESQEAVV